MDKARLISAFTKSGSDKSYLHHYEIAYSKILPDYAENLLEIGIANYVPEVSSLHAWRELYPNATVYAIEIVPEKIINNEFIKSFLMDQSDISKLNEFKNEANCKFDFIIDDGSHMFEHSRVSFEQLWDCVKDGGIYAIEDIQKVRKYTYQTLSDWETYLQNRGISYEIFDCKPYLDDDSIVICISK